jgi:hypothetical protein
MDNKKFEMADYLIANIDAAACAVILLQVSRSFTAKR